MSSGSLIKLKRRINSLANLRTIISTMELVAIAKIPRLREKNTRASDYFSETYRSFLDVCDSHIYGENIYTRKHDIKKTCIVAVGGDRGFAGAYHASFLKELKKTAENKTVIYLPIGKKTQAQTTKLGGEVLHKDGRPIDDMTVSACKELADKLTEYYKAGMFDELVLVFTNFVSMMTQTPISIKILPVHRNSAGNANLKSILYEPDTDEIFDHLVPQFISGFIYGAVCESYMSETAARKTSMNSAKKNADELIEQMRIKYNRIRQESITQEITEIVSDISEEWDDYD